VLDEALIGQLVEAMDGPNATAYRLATPDAVQAFLEAHHGQRVFTVSW
jgi:hypothetical protein